MRKKGAIPCEEVAYSEISFLKPRFVKESILINKNFFIVKKDDV